MTITETIAEVLRLDEEATPGPWEYHPCWGNIFDESSDPPFSCRRGETRDEDDGAAIVGVGNVEVLYEGTFEPYDQTAGVLGAVPADAALIAYYRTAAPALAREVERLQGEVERLRPRPSFCLQCLYDLAGSDCCPECGAEVQDSSDGYQEANRAGQEAMRERCMEVCSELILRARVCAGDDEGLRDLRCLESHMLRAIRALEVE